MISEGIKELAQLKATPDQRVDALVPWLAEKIAIHSFKNPNAIACRAETDLARELIEPLRAALIAGFAAIDAEQGTRT